MSANEEPVANGEAPTRGPIVMEIHIDFLLEEEFNANPHFLNKFAQACRPKLEPDSLIDVAHSVSGPRGESDLVVRYRERKNDGATVQRIGILIEDKIGAPLQPEQAERYRTRGRAGLGTDWDDFVTCLVAPARYVKGKHGFDAVITLETIRNWIGSIEPGRRDFKHSVIDKAIRKEAITGPKVPDAAMTEFRRRYFAALQAFNATQGSTLIMHPPGESYSGECWFRLNSALLPKGVYISHKSERGAVDLTFTATDFIATQSDKNFLEDGMTLEKTEKSTAVRLRVPLIDRYDNFASAASIVGNAFEAAVRLVGFYVRERARIEPIFKSART